MCSRGDIKLELSVGYACNSLQNKYTIIHGIPLQHEASYWTNCWVMVDALYGVEWGVKQCKWTCRRRERMQMKIYVLQDIHLWIRSRKPNTQVSMNCSLIWEDVNLTLTGVIYTHECKFPDGGSGPMILPWQTGTIPSHPKWSQRRLVILLTIW